MFKPAVLPVFLISALVMSPTISAGQTSAEIITKLESNVADDAELKQYLNGLAQQVSRGPDHGDRALRSTLQIILDMSPSGGITRDQIDAKHQADIASMRGNQIGRILAYDLDGDGAISQDERLLRAGRAAVDIELLFTQGDADTNGSISFSEILAYVVSQIPDGQVRSNYQHLMLFDLDGDGVVRTDEVTSVINALADSGTILPGAMPGRTVSQNATCAAPKPTERAEVVVLSAYEGAALSTASVAGMDDVTHVAHITIEDGDTPFYIFMTAHANMIWDISGDLDRVETVVVQKPRRNDGGAGVIGVAASKVHFVERVSCMNPIWSVEGGEGIIAYRQVATSLGQDPDHMLAHYTIGTISLPSGDGSKVDGEGSDVIIYDGKRFEIGPDGPRIIDETADQLPGSSPFGARQAYRSMLRFNPGGLRDIAVDAVTASGTVATYDVLPQQAGLLQLLLEGKMTYTRDGFYMINEPIARFPAGLAGSHSVKFMLGDGIPLPNGSPGHSSVYSAETGQCLTGVRCR